MQNKINEQQLKIEELIIHNEQQEKKETRIIDCKKWQSECANKINSLKIHFKKGELKYWDEWDGDVEHAKEYIEETKNREISSDEKSDVAKISAITKRNEPLVYNLLNGECKDYQNPCE